MKPFFLKINHKDTAQPGIRVRGSGVREFGRNHKGLNNLLHALENSSQKNKNLQVCRAERRSTSCGATMQFCAGASFFLLAWAMFTPHALAGQESAAPAMSFDADSLPFPLGERIEFQIQWKPPAWLFFIPTMNAGKITLEVTAGNHHTPTPTLRVTGQVLSSGTFSSLAGIKVQNYYESTMNACSLCSMQFIFKRREGKRLQDLQIDFQSGEESLHVKKWDVSKDPPLETRNEVLKGIPSCVQDLMSIFYSTRRLPIEPGKNQRVFLANDDARIQQIELHIDKEETVQTGLGPLSAYRIQTLGLFGGLFRSGGEFTIWLEKAGKYPVKFEAKVKLGRVSGVITHYVPSSTDAKGHKEELFF
jgi:hypothetical protein